MDSFLQHRTTFLNLVLLPVDSSLQHRTTFFKFGFVARGQFFATSDDFQNLGLFPWTISCDIGQILKPDFITRGQFIGQKNTAINMGLWQVGRTE